jgi:transposase
MGSVSTADTGSAAPGFVAIVADGTGPGAVPRQLSAAAVIEIKLAGAGVRVVSRIDDAPPPDRCVAGGTGLGIPHMINIPAGVRILLATRPIDFRKGGYSLAALAQEVLGEDPFSGTVIVYRAKRGDRIKILVWDSGGLVLIWKQLQQASFRWPPIMDGVMRLSAVEFAALFDGLNWTRVQATNSIHKTTVAV